MTNRTRNADGTMAYRAALVAERARLSRGMEQALEALAAPGGVGLEDQPPLVHDQFVALRLNASDRRKLRLIDAALERMDSGEFGYCAECDEGIPPKRLQVIPWAMYCVPCQERIDGRSEEGLDERLQMIA
ncbi:MAG TPA: TraR/DksA family transcriptional regulator [Bryobacteraceae bacterium]|nr:TraR/DksA family transcriptional regulator [Bryobacteraceae bacterium]